MALRDPPADLAEHGLGAAAARVAPRTSGITQNAHENEQPSWIFTNARTRSSRASACTQPIAPTSPATISAACSIWPATTVTFGRQPGERVAREFARRSRSRRHAACVRAAREAALRRFARPSFVTQQVLITATSPRPGGLAWPSRSSRSRSACASACETLQPRNSTRERSPSAENRTRRTCEVAPPSRRPGRGARPARSRRARGSSETR